MVHHKTSSGKVFTLPLLMVYAFYLRVDIRIGSVLLDEFAAGFYVVAHEHGEDFVGLSSILNGDLLQETGFGVHSGFPKLFGIHLTKTFVALGMQGGGILVAGNILVDECLTLLFGVAIL
jgi:hypothetical protein